MVNNICNGWNGERTGPLACLSLFAIKIVDEGHQLRLWFSKLPCYPNLFPNNGTNTHCLLQFEIPIQIDKYETYTCC